jgi:hypothetical protein
MHVLKATLHGLRILQGWLGIISSWYEINWPSDNVCLNHFHSWRIALGMQTNINKPILRISWKTGRQTLFKLTFGFAAIVIESTSMIEEPKALWKWRTQTFWWFVGVNLYGCTVDVVVIDAEEDEDDDAIVDPCCVRYDAVHWWEVMVNYFILSLFVILLFVFYFVVVPQRLAGFERMPSEY